MLGQCVPRLRVLRPPEKWLPRCRVRWPLGLDLPNHEIPFPPELRLPRNGVPWPPVIQLPQHEVVLISEKILSCRGGYLLPRYEVYLPAYTDMGHLSLSG